MLKLNVDQAAREMHKLNEENKELFRQQNAARQAMTKLAAEGKKGSKEWQNLSKSVKEYRDQINANNEKRGRCRKTHRPQNYGICFIIAKSLQLGTSGYQSLACLVVLVLDEVLDEAASQILGLLFPLCSVGIGVARVEDAGVNALELGGNSEVEERNHLGRSVVDAVVEDSVDDATGVAN